MREDHRARDDQEGATTHMSSRQTVIKVGPGDTTLRARLLGTRLREKREAAGLKLVAAATLNKRRPATLSRWETGERLPHPSELFYALEVYGVRGAERDALMHIAQEAHERKDSPDFVSTAVADYDWLVRSACRLEYFSDTAPPGLLQTPEYAREILKMWDPAASRERIERTLAARMARQERLAGEDALEVCVVLGEGALRCVVGGPEAMRAQLRHLLDCAALPTVELRVVPFAVGAHPGFAGAFTILRFPDGRALAHVVTRAGDIYAEDAEPFAQALRRIKRVALSRRESVAMIAALTKAMT
jgi:transcriptional regulator with XRE-family HTH domain